MHTHTRTHTLSLSLSSFKQDSELMTKHRHTHLLSPVYYRSEITENLMFSYSLFSICSLILYKLFSYLCVSCENAKYCIDICSVIRFVCRSEIGAVRKVVPLISRNPGGWYLNVFDHMDCGFDTARLHR